jgi:hypothetical protein
MIHGAHHKLNKVKSSDKLDYALGRDVNPSCYAILLVNSIKIYKKNSPYFQFFGEGFIK